MTVHIETAITFAATLPVLLVAHNVADHWVQTEHQALNKGGAGWPGRLACAAHIGTYTVVTALAVGLMVCTLALPVTVIGFVAGQGVSAVSHYVADRRSTLQALARFIGKAEFYTLGSPRPGRDDNPSLGTGAYALDQSWHWLWLLVAAIVTAVA
jgi:hypothetical protein